MQYIVKPYDLQWSEDYKEYAENLPFLYDHCEEIYSNPEYFFTPLPYTIYGLKYATCIGAILKAFDRGAPYRVVKEDGSIEFVASYAGSPMSGSTSGVNVVVTGNVVEIQRFKSGGFLSMVRRMVEDFHESAESFRESPFTLHNIITKVKSNEEDSDVSA